jgi:omega-6 fatty acid desaturase (delta-12 desaturase)
MLDRHQYMRIKAQLDFTRSHRAILGIMALDLLLATVVILLLLESSTLGFVIAQLLLVVLFFHNFSIVHECGHGNFSRYRMLNVIVGHYASVICFTPFFPWRYIHQQHHVWAGNSAADPAGRSVRIWRTRGQVPRLIRLCWRTWVPLTAFAQHIVFWSYPWVLAREDRSKLPKCLLSVGLLPLAYALLYFSWPSIFKPSNFILAFVIYLFVEELVNAPHHIDLFNFSERLPLWEQWKATRSCVYPPLLSKLLVLNFNLHVEHHLYPSLPWQRLGTARALIRPALGSNYCESVGIGWNLQNRSRDLQDILVTVRAETRSV